MSRYFTRRRRLSTPVEYCHRIVVKFVLVDSIIQLIVPTDHQDSVSHSKHLGLTVRPVVECYRYYMYKISQGCTTTTTKLSVCHIPSRYPRWFWKRTWKCRKQKKYYLYVDLSGIKILVIRDFEFPTEIYSYMSLSHNFDSFNDHTLSLSCIWIKIVKVL